MGETTQIIYKIQEGEVKDFLIVIFQSGCELIFAPCLLGL